MSDDLFTGLTVKERRFIEAYVGEAAGNGTRAAELAGYKGNTVTLGSVAAQNLRKHQIRAAVDRLLEQDPLVAGRVERLRRLTAVARGELMYETMNREGDVVRVCVHPREQLTALRLLGELAGDYRPPDKNGPAHSFPPGLTIDELFALAGIDRPGPRAPVLSSQLFPPKPEPADEAH